VDRKKVVDPAKRLIDGFLVLSPLFRQKSTEAVKTHVDFCPENPKNRRKRASELLPFLIRVVIAMPFMVPLFTGQNQESMKRGILAAFITSVALSFTSTSHAQGHILLDNFVTDGPNVVYGSGFPNPGTGILDGQNGSVGNVTWTIGFYYALGDVTGSVGSDPFGFGSTSFNGLTLATGTGSTTGLLGPSDPGQFTAANDYTVGGYTSGLVTVEIIAYSGSDYISSFLRGHSAAFTMTPATNPGLAPSVGAAMPSFAINIVPEPSAIALICAGVSTWILSSKRRRR
jgi:hypothetical protein